MAYNHYLHILFYQLQNVPNNNIDNIKLDLYQDTTKQYLLHHL